jgi:hypothetical protein
MQAHLCSPLGVSKQLKLSSANERDGNTAIMMVNVRRVARMSPSLVITLYRKDASIGERF